jgi:hypothetical protein
MGRGPGKTLVEKPLVLGRDDHLPKSQAHGRVEKEPGQARNAVVLARALSTNPRTTATSITPV